MPEGSKMSEMLEMLKNLKYLRYKCLKDTGLRMQRVKENAEYLQV